MCRIFYKMDTLICWLFKEFDSYVDHEYLQVISIVWMVEDLDYLSSYYGRVRG